jgi:hypothetical protein
MTWILHLSPKCKPRSTLNTQQFETYLASDKYERHLDAAGNAIRELKIPIQTQSAHH